MARDRLPNGRWPILPCGEDHDDSPFHSTSSTPSTPIRTSRSGRVSHPSSSSTPSSVLSAQRLVWTSSATGPDGWSSPISDYASESHFQSPTFLRTAYSGNDSFGEKDYVDGDSSLGLRPQFDDPVFGYSPGSTVRDSGGAALNSTRQPSQITSSTYGINSLTNGCAGYWASDNQPVATPAEAPALPNNSPTSSGDNWVTEQSPTLSQVSLDVHPRYGI